MRQIAKYETRARRLTAVANLCDPPLIADLLTAIAESYNLLAETNARMAAVQPLNVSMLTPA